MHEHGRMYKRERIKMQIYLRIITIQEIFNDVVDVTVRCCCLQFVIAK